ncbi:transposase [Aeromonas schubertii]|uniref:transposase n=1 Tax=Aeromonas schubertii TaxID=652 RepID=UPI0010A8B7F7|nr:transposase [Aeromonas schubertii]QCG48041.1 transposase [Aeromonas schubertii]
MPLPRRSQVSLADTPYYHCVVRCVRRAYLCGLDVQSGQSYAHRREWVESRILLLGQLFAIHICAYAVMSNHLHLVLHVDKESALGWSDAEVVERWHRLCSGTFLTRRFAKGESLDEAQWLAVQATIGIYRQRLMDISWLMRLLCEPIARQANREDGCTGHFWEGRFKSQALLNESALLACMAYVELNPVRAAMAETPESSDFTSIQRRIRAALEGKQPDELLPFVGDEHQALTHGLTFSLADYLELVDESGRWLRGDKRGAMSPGCARILARLGLPAAHWEKLTRDFRRLFKGPAGTPDELGHFCEHLQRKRRQGLANGRRWLCA